MGRVWVCWGGRAGQCGMVAYPDVGVAVCLMSWILPIFHEWVCQLVGMEVSRIRWVSIFPMIHHLVVLELWHQEQNLVWEDHLLQFVPVLQGRRRLVVVLCGLRSYELHGT